LKSFVSLDFAVDGSSEELLYRQIYLRFKEAILNGSYPPGARVPSIRTLAAELKISRSTIETAYDLLIGEDFFLSNGQAGTVVAPTAHRHLFASTASALPDDEGTAGNERPFQIGVPALDAFPLSTWHALSKRHLESRWEIGQAEVQGYLPLRKAIAAYLSVSRGIGCAPSQVFVTSGYRQSLLLLCSALLKSGDAVWTEDPVFPPTRHLLDQLGVRQIPVPVDMEGMNVAQGQRLASDAVMAVVTPANQSPLGTVLSMRRRLALLAWAAEHRAWLLEDDHDSEYCSEGRLLQTLSSLDRAGRTCYLGTFSKSLHPALRLAYVVVPDTVSPLLAEVAERMLDGCPLHVQKTLAAFMSEGNFGRHLKKMRALYSHRRDLLVCALQKQMGSQLRISPFSRGLCLLAYLPNDCDDVEMARKACAAGLSVASLSPRAIEHDCGRGLLLGFANLVDEEAADKAVRALSACFTTDDADLRTAVT